MAIRQYLGSTRRTQRALSATAALRPQRKGAHLASHRPGSYNVCAMIVANLPDEAATAALAGRISALAEAGDVIALKGELGTGKTSFARAFIRARGNPDEEVPSPTFTLAQVYELDPVPIWHFDLYRLNAPDEAWELGIEEAFGEAISLIEWPERLGTLLPMRRLQLTLTFADRSAARQISFDPGTAWQARLAAVATNA
jgi:tRNA threonylcarbamoyladenosine biosynthesis protein TsaE